MQIVCTACGAPIDIQPGATMVACRYCGRANEVRKGPLVPSPRVATRGHAVRQGLIVFGAITALSAVGMVVTRLSSGPTPDAVDTQVSGAAASLEAPRVRQSVEFGGCLGAHGGGPALDMAGLYAWTDDEERYVVSVVDGDSGTALFRGEELPEGSSVLCGRDGHFAIGTPDFKVRFYGAGRTEPVVHQLSDAVGQFYAVGADCYAIELANDEVEHFSYAGEPREACAGARSVHDHWGASLDAGRMFGEWGSRQAFWVGVQDGISYELFTAHPGTPIISVTARRGDVSEELASLERAVAMQDGLLPEPDGVPAHQVGEEARRTLRQALDRLEEAWSVRLAVAGSETFVAVLTPNTLIVHGVDPAGGDEPYRLVGVGLGGGSIRYTLELDHDVFTLQHNGRYALADGRGANYALDPDSGERAWEFGL